MKDLTTIEKIIKNIKDEIKNEESEIKFLTGHYTIQLLTLYLSYEQEMIEKAFEDGVGEGLTDPERPFTGKEYYHVVKCKPSNQEQKRSCVYGSVSALIIPSVCCMFRLLPKHYSYLNTKRFWSCLDNIKCVWGG